MKKQTKPPCQQRKRERGIKRKLKEKKRSRCGIGWDRTKQNTLSLSFFAGQGERGGDNGLSVSFTGSGTKENNVIQHPRRTDPSSHPFNLTTSIPLLRTTSLDYKGKGRGRKRGSEPTPIFHSSSFPFTHAGCCLVLFVPFFLLMLLANNLSWLLTHCPDTRIDQRSDHT
mmetsp:Transcript_46495/g.91790  ORF Transcript_46495/g.91790 Transcript_46495/m.91790 type:complete len:170 (-) Transcript_46495:642-1151(-)